MMVWIFLILVLWLFVIFPQWRNIANIIDDFSDSEKNWRDLGLFIRRIFIYLPPIYLLMLIFGVLLHIKDDFKNHRLGYVVIFLVISFIGFAIYLGVTSDSSGTPAPWQ